MAAAVAAGEPISKPSPIPKELAGRRIPSERGENEESIASSTSRRKSEYRLKVNSSDEKSKR
jgi:hypothetical protein